MKVVPLLFVFIVQLTGPAAGASGETPSKWVGTWVSAQQLVEEKNMPPAPGLSGQTLRQIIQPSLDGRSLRLTFSNEFGDTPLTIASASVARSGGKSVIEDGTARPVTFNGATQVTLPPGALAVSDFVPFEVQAFVNLAVSTYCTAVPAKLTGHPGSRTTSFMQKGDGTIARELGQATPTDHWYLLAAVDVQANPEAQAIAIIGDSITDGRGSITNSNNRWPNNLARRLHANPHTANISVLNQGIGGNRLLRNGLGPAAIERFERDVLTPPGVRWVLVFEGVNDLGTAVGARAKGEPAATAKDIIACYEQMIARAHARGLLIYGATITPFQGFTSYYETQSEADRQTVNHWIRSSGRFDGVVDFDAITRDPANPPSLSSVVDGGDHLHPSAAGYQVMADAVDLALFEKSVRN